jgi:hypothetical protein
MRRVEIRRRENMHLVCVVEAQRNGEHRFFNNDRAKSSRFFFHDESKILEHSGFFLELKDLQIP